MEHLMANMKISDWTGWIGMALGATALAFLFRDKPPKIGYAETTTLMSQFGEAIKARKRFETHAAEWEKNTQALKDSLDVAMDRLKLEYEKAPEAQKAELRAMLEKRNDDLQKYSNAVKKMSETKEAELMSPVISQLNSFMKTWGKQHGYDIILGTSTGGNILHADPNLDVTPGLLKELNEFYKDLPAAETSKPAPVDTLQVKDGTKQ